MPEPSVLDYVKAKLTFWKKSEIDFSVFQKEAAPEIAENGHENTAEIFLIEPEPAVNPAEVQAQAADHPWLVWLPIGVALVAQILLELWATIPSGQANQTLSFFVQRSLGAPDQYPFISLALYAITSVFVLVFGAGGEYKLVASDPAEPCVDHLDASWWQALIGLPLALIAFLLFGGNRFTTLNVVVWVMAIAAFLFAFARPLQVSTLKWRAQRFWQFLTRPGRTWNIRIPRWTLLVLAVVGIVLFFRFYRLDQLPIDMISDHAEKLLDINDVLHGVPSIFFERNTGREPFQFYWTALVIKLFGLTVSFFSLKLGTVLIGLITAYYTYRLGDLLGGRWVALLSLLFIGVAYWPNVISRIALRFPFYPFFVAPLLLYLLRGFRTGARNDFIWAGIWLGIGLNGYTSSRIVPFLVVVAFALYLFSKSARGKRQQAMFDFFLVTLFAMLICIPLGRYAFDHQDAFLYRSLTRLGNAERPIPGNPLEIFIGNFWSAITMFFYNNGSIWVHSIPYRPALDVVMGAFFFLGFFLLLARYIKERSWEDLFLVLSIPILILPSALSIAFPGENPSLNRTSGVYVPVFIITAIGMVSLLREFPRRLPATGKRVAVVLGLALVLWTVSNNYNLFFVQYDQQYKQSAWNTREIGGVVRDFADLAGTYDTYYVVGFPYWIDSRQVAIFAGHIERDAGILPEQIPQTLADPRMKMYIVKPEDTTTLAILRQFYPEGRVELHKSPQEGKDFILFITPSKSNVP